MRLKQLHWFDTINNLYGTTINLSIPKIFFLTICHLKSSSKHFNILKKVGWNYSSYRTQSFYGGHYYSDVLGNPAEWEITELHLQEPLAQHYNLSSSCHLRFFFLSQRIDFVKMRSHLGSSWHSLLASVHSMFTNPERLRARHLKLLTHISLFLSTCWPVGVLSGISTCFETRPYT